MAPSAFRPPAFPFSSPDTTTTTTKRIEGMGAFTFPDGQVYRGHFKDGQFHGSGTIHFTHGAKYEATWNKGIAIQGTYTFKDGLTYDESAAWDYCNPGSDRRFYSERIHGFQPGPPQLTDQRPTLSIPLGSYDTGNGYYEPKSAQMHGYDGQALDSSTPRDPTEVDAPAWIIANCRVGERE